MASRGWALVTGASVGIGRELAKLAAADGYDLILVARDADALDALSKELPTAAIWFALDLATPDGPELLAQAIESRGIVPELLVNNAGVGAWGLSRDLPLSAELTMVDLNVRALLFLTKRFLPAFIARRRGRILNVASTAAFQPGPYMAVYYATKAFVLHYSEALAHELSGRGVTVTTLCPGPTRSAFQERAGMQRSSLFVGGLLSIATAESVAAAGYRGALAGKRLVVPGLINRILVFSVRFAPRRVATAIAAFVARPA